METLLDNEELIDEVVGQAVDIYKVVVEETDTNMYGESKDGKKYFSAAFRVNCLISFDEPITNLEEFGSDLNANLEMYFHRTTLKEAGFFPEIGDIVDWNDSYYEVNSVTEPQLIGGHAGFKHQIKVNATKSRLSSLHIEKVGD